MRRICIIQSAYIPWRGFFDLIDRCDEYVILDGAQFVKGHWQNRNRVCGPAGPTWLSIPVLTADRLGQSIDEVIVSDRSWAETHWRKLATYYAVAPFFSTVGPELRVLFEAAGQCERLTDINEILMRGIVSMLGIETTFVRDKLYDPQGMRTDRVVDICIKAGATHYLTGPSARAYLDETPFNRAGITVEWMSYPSYKPYPQGTNPYDPALSIVDLLLNAGVGQDDLWRGRSSAEAPYEAGSPRQEGGSRAT